MSKGKGEERWIRKKKVLQASVFETPLSLRTFRGQGIAAPEI
jgi:hypothetical protein